MYWTLVSALWICICIAFSLCVDIKPIKRQKGPRLPRRRGSAHLTTQVTNRKPWSTYDAWSVKDYYTGCLVKIDNCFFKRQFDTQNGSRRKIFVTFKMHGYYIRILLYWLAILKSSSANSSGIGQTKNQTFFWKRVVDAKKPKFYDVYAKFQNKTHKYIIKFGFFGIYHTFSIPYPCHYKPHYNWSCPSIKRC